MKERNRRDFGLVTFDVAHAEGCPHCFGEGPPEYGLIFWFGELREDGTGYLLRLTQKEVNRLKEVIQSHVLSRHTGRNADSRSQSVRFKIQSHRENRSPGLYEMHTRAFP